jgi:hypothetical protein
MSRLAETAAGLEVFGLEKEGVLRTTAMGGLRAGGGGTGLENEMSWRAKGVEVC